RTRGPRPAGRRQAHGAAGAAVGRRQAPRRRAAVARRGRALAGGAGLQRPARIGRCERPARPWSPLRTALGAGSPALSLVGCLDPARLGEAMAGSEDGRAARLLYAWPRPAPYQRFLERPELRESDAVNALQHIAAVAGDSVAPLAL